MKDIIRKLLSDLRLRLRGKKRERPGKKEIGRWGVSQLPPMVPLLLFIAYFAFARLGSPQELLPMLPAWLHYILFAWPGWILVFVGLQESHKAVNRHLTVSAYHDLLKKNERFTLFEYCKYLERQIERAAKDQSMGGLNEMKRLKLMHGKLYSLLRKGVAKDEFAVESELSREADLAEAVIETYELTDTDLLKGLDDRLPEAIRQRIEELDLEADGQRSRLAE